MPTCASPACCLAIAGTDLITSTMPIMPLLPPKLCSLQPTAAMSQHTVPHVRVTIL